MQHHETLEQKCNTTKLIANTPNHAPGTKVFWGLPLMNGTPSMTQAMAYSVDGDISASFLSTDASRFSIVSLRPAHTLLYLSVFAVHNTTILSTLFFSLNSLFH
jgi:hypothetical protein